MLDLPRALYSLDASAEPSIEVQKVCHDLRLLQRSSFLKAHLASRYACQPRSIGRMESFVSFLSQPGEFL